MATLMVVDDEPSVRALAVRLLRADGHEVVEARDGREAWTRLGRRGWAVDALLTDVVMPGLTGTELAALVQTRRPGLPVVLMSGYTNDDLLQRGLRLSHGLLLTKPFTRTALLTRVREALGDSP
jgi:two-component system cell cycle sensor histidine kinase/response regulator CckA